MEQITPLQFWSGVIIALIPQVFSLIIKLKELRAAAPQVKATSASVRTTIFMISDLNGLIGHSNFTTVRG